MWMWSYTIHNVIICLDAAGQSASERVPDVQITILRAAADELTVTAYESRLLDGLQMCVSSVTSRL